MSNGVPEPSALRFSQILRRLVSEGDSRGVIRLVERWLEHGTVSQTARIAQARAFMDLKLMDRAWVRLREAAKAESGSIVVQMLTAEMFVERGWPTKALPILERINISDLNDNERALWSLLRTAAAKPPEGPPEDAAEIERSGAADEVLKLAEVYLACGSHVRAESLLERLLRDGYSPPRVSDLLWALHGEFVSPNMPTAALLTELGGDDSRGEWVSLELTDSLVIDETAHVDVEDARFSSLAEATRRAFPRLFRRDENTSETTADDPGEVTMSSLSVESDPEEFEQGSTDPEGTPFPGSGDTKIMQVISRGDGVSVQPLSGSIHRESGDRQTFDLKSHRETYLPPDDETFLEDEDQDLIVMTRRERSESPLPRPKQEPVEELKSAEKIKTKPDLLAPDTLSENGPSAEEGSDSVLDEESGRSAPWAPVMGVIVFTGFAAWMVFAVLHWIAQGQIVEETHQVIAAADFRGLQELEAKLEAQVEAGRSPIAVRQVELALVRAILWSDYTGDSDRMLSAQDGLDRARESGAPSDEVLLASGYMSLTMGDLQSARSVVGELSMDGPLQRDLTARVALRVRGDAESRTLLASLGPIDGSTPLLELLSRESLLATLDEEEQVAALRLRLLREHSNSPFVQIQRFHEQWDEGEVSDVLVMLDDVMETLPGPVSARQEGRLHAQRATLLTERGDAEAAEQSWASALVVDPTHPRYLHHAAAVRLADNKVVAALDDLDRCLGARPWDQSCRRGMVQVLIELDRLEEARQIIDAWGSERTVVLRAWVERAAGNPEVALATLESENGALASWVRGMALLDMGSPDASVALEPAVEGWAGVSQPMIRILVARARVAQAMSTGDLELMMATLEEWGSSDPVAMIMVAQRMDEAGQRATAQQLFQDAASRGPESAIALHALGLFWFDPRSSLDSARSVWRRYLDLQPSGDRARRTRARMGRR